MALKGGNCTQRQNLWLNHQTGLCALAQMLLGPCQCHLMQLLLLGSWLSEMLPKPSHATENHEADDSHQGEYMFSEPSALPQAL